MMKNLAAAGSVPRRADEVYDVRGRGGMVGLLRKGAANSPTELKSLQPESRTSHHRGFP